MKNIKEGARKREFKLNSNILIPKHNEKILSLNFLSQVNVHVVS